MNKDKLKQYERWPFPNNYFISREGLLLLRYLDKFLAESGRPNCRVIDIGCGTGNTLIPLAQRYDHVKFTGVDISENSLEIATSNTAVKRLVNIEFKKADVLDKEIRRMGIFDIILCLGVLHHVRDMETAIKNLAGILAKKGHMILWFYGRYGRYKHRLNQRLIKILSKKAADKEKYLISRALIEEGGGKFVLNTGFFSPRGTGKRGVDWLKENPQWLVDQFIPEYEKNVTMKELYLLLEKNHMKISNWFGVQTKIDSHFSSQVLRNHADKLSQRERLIAIDNLLKPEYYFVAAEKGTIKRGNLW